MYGSVRPDSGKPHPFRRKVVSTKAIPHTQTGQVVTLTCGHKVLSFGSLGHTPDGVICEQCAIEAARRG